MILQILIHFNFSTNVQSIPYICFIESLIDLIANFNPCNFLLASLTEWFKQCEFKSTPRSKYFEYFEKNVQYMSKCAFNAKYLFDSKFRFITLKVWLFHIKYLSDSKFPLLALKVWLFHIKYLSDSKIRLFTLKVWLFYIKHLFDSKFCLLTLKVWLQIWIHALLQPSSLALSDFVRWFKQCEFKSSRRSKIILSMSFLSMIHSGAKPPSTRIWFILWVVKSS